MTIVYIHGANATTASFNYIKTHIGDGILLSYSSSAGFKSNLERMISELKDTKDVTFIAHSLGGVYALHLANALPAVVKQGITLSTPYGGHAIADYAKLFMPFDQLLQDIGPASWPIQTANKIDIQWPWCNIVTTKGNVPWISDRNDGVVTLASQRHKTDMELIDIDLNHYEVVLSPLTVTAINNRLTKVT
jgi:pimeloyl-ACP methyl ester carboxylesterase